MMKDKRKLGLLLIAVSVLMIILITYFDPESQVNSCFERGICAFWQSISIFTFLVLLVSFAIMTFGFYYIFSFVTLHP